MIWRGGPSLLVPAKARDAAPINHPLVRMPPVMRTSIHTGTTAGTVLPQGARGGDRLRGREHSTAPTSQPPAHLSGRLGLGDVYALLHGGHVCGDHWVQSGPDAQAKAGEGWPARIACARHVAQLAVTQGLFLTLGCAVTQKRLSPRRVAIGLALNAVTHYALDRRPLARKLAHACGKAAFYDNFPVQRDGWLDPHGPGSGPNALDQAAHVAILALVSAYIAGGRR